MLRGELTAALLAMFFLFSQLFAPLCGLFFWRMGWFAFTHNDPKVSTSRSFFVSGSDIDIISMGFWLVFVCNQNAGTPEEASSFIYPNGWKHHSYRKVCVIENPSYFSIPFASTHQKKAAFLVFLAILFANAFVSFKPTKLEDGYIRELFKSCDTNNDGYMEPELACLPFNPGVESAFGIGRMDSDDPDDLVSEAEFKVNSVARKPNLILSSNNSSNFTPGILSGQDLGPHFTCRAPKKPL